MSAAVREPLGDIAARFVVLPQVLALALDVHGSDAMAWVWLEGTRIMKLEVES